MKDPFTTEFKVVVGIILIIGAFALIGGNELLLRKEVKTAVQTSDEAVSLSSKTVAIVKDLIPTVTPTATPSAVKKFVPVTTSKTVTPAK